MAIEFIESTKTFFLDGKGMTYAFYINEYGFAEHLFMTIPSLQMKRIYSPSISRISEKPDSFRMFITSGETCVNTIQEPSMSSIICCADSSDRSAMLAM